MSEFISVHPCDSNPASLSLPLVLFESQIKELGHSLQRKMGMTWVSQLLFPAAGPLEGRWPTQSEHLWQQQTHCAWQVMALESSISASGIELIFARPGKRRIYKRCKKSGLFKAPREWYRLGDQQPCLSGKVQKVRGRVKSYLLTSSDTLIVPWMISVPHSSSATFQLATSFTQPPPTLQSSKKRRQLWLFIYSVSAV